MRPITTFVLAGIAIGLLGFIFLFERHWDSASVSAEKSTRALNFDPATVQRITISNSQGDAVFVRDDEGVWWMEEPRRDRLFQRDIDELATIAADLRILDTVLPGEAAEAGKFGLAENPVVIGFESPGEKPQTLYFGSPSPIEDSVYAATSPDSEEVFVVDDLARNFASLDFDNFRDSWILGAKLEDLRRVKFANGEGGTILLERPDRKTPWMLVKPINERTSRKSLETVLAPLANLRAESFIDEPGAEVAAAFESTSKHISLWVIGKRGSVTLDFGVPPGSPNAAGLVYARISNRPDTVFTVSPDILAAFPMSPADLRATTLADFKPQIVTRVEIENAGFQKPKVVLRRAGRGWVSNRRGEIEDANGMKIERFLETVNETPIVEFVSDTAAQLPDYGLDRPSMTLTVESLEDIPESEADANLAKTVERKLLVGSPRKLVEGADALYGRIFAHWDKSPFIYEIDSTLPSAMNPNAVRWKGLRVLSFNIFTLRKISIEQPPQPPLVLNFDFRTAHWDASILSEDRTPMLDIRRANELAQLLGQFRAVDWMSEPNAALKMLEEPIMSIGIEVETLAKKDGEPPVRTTDVIQIAPTHPTVRGAFFYARRNDDDEVFTISREIYEKLKRPLLDANKSTSIPTPLPTAPSTAPQ